MKQKTCTTSFNSGKVNKQNEDFKPSWINGLLASFEWPEEDREEHSELLLVFVSADYEFHLNWHRSCNSTSFLQNVVSSKNTLIEFLTFKHDNSQQNSQNKMKF